MRGLIHTSCCVYFVTIFMWRFTGGQMINNTNEGNSTTPKVPLLHDDIKNGTLKDPTLDGDVRNGTVKDTSLDADVRNGTSEVPIVGEDVQTNVTNVTICQPGFGYPEQCPQPWDPNTHTKCCRHYQTPTCCEPRARKVCASKNKGLVRVSDWDIDPDPDMDAIFCPQDGQSDAYTSCGYTRGDMTCYNKIAAAALVWITTLIIFIIFPVAFGIFVIISIRKEKRKEQEMLLEGRFLTCEVEVEARMAEKKAEKAAARKAADNPEKVKAKQRQIMGNGRKSMRSSSIEVT